MLDSQHPLDPLNSLEISTSSEIIRNEYPGKDWIFNSITLLEPPKQSILHYLEKKDIEIFENLERKSFVILIEKNIGNIFEVTVNLTKKKVERFYSVPIGYQPTITPEECFIAEKVAKEDIEVIQLCKNLQIENMDLVVGDPWSIGYSGYDSELEGKRLIQLFMYYREFDGDNHYSHPLDFVPIVDVNAEKVIRIDQLPSNSNGINIKTRIPKYCHNYDPKFLSKDFHRKDIKSLDIISPNGPSFTVHGNEIQWQKFKLRISFNYREGLVLHNVTYQDGVKERSLLYRASLAEMVVPYGDPNIPFHRKCAFDVGDYGLGFCTNSLKHGCDCLGTIKYFDGILNNHNGDPIVLKNAICLHEEDAGILFKHTEYRTGEATITRSRKLVLSFITTVVNYEYAMYWTFSQDGSIGFEVKATGELSTNLINTDVNSPHGSLVAQNINAQFHQHLFAIRLDTMFDGVKNNVSILDVQPLEQEFGSIENPYGQGFTLKEKLLKTNHEAKTDISSETSRIWKISNPCSINEITKKPVGFKLIPMNGPKLLAKPNSFIGKRAGFATHSIWVTPYNEQERFPAGFYVNQSKGGDGLPEWTKDEKNIVNEDVVLWHVFGVTHIPRVEDFPIMSVESCGFTLKPCNFFHSNPGLDVPPSGCTGLIQCHMD